MIVLNRTSRLMLTAATVWLANAAFAAEVFESKMVTRVGRSFGVVTSFTAHLFVISKPAGGYTVEQRSTIVSQRLNDILKEKELAPDTIASGIVNHQNAVYYTDRAGVKHPIITADPYVATDAGVGRETLAAWWAALLKDHLSIALGVRPRYTTGTETGKVFDRIFEITKGETTEEAFSHIAEALSPKDKRHLMRTAWKVDSGFSPQTPAPKRD